MLARNTMLTLGATLATAGATQSATALFAQFKADHGKQYNSSEEIKRFAVFEQNLDFIAAENAKGHGFTLGIGPFADLTEAEFQAQYTGGKPAEPAVHAGPTHLGEYKASVEAPAIDEDDFHLFLSHVWSTGAGLWSIEPDEPPTSLDDVAR